MKLPNKSPTSKRARAGVTLGIGELKALNKNARRRTQRSSGVLVESLQKYGAARSIVIDEENTVLAGNGTVDAAGEAGIERVRVVEADGHELIAVRRRGLSAAAKQRYALADNRSAELAEWDVEILREMHESGADLRGLWGEDELREIFATEEPKAGLTDPDDVPAGRPTSIKAGDLFKLGEHRLLCGDSTKAEDVARLMGDERAGLMNTDPPYGVTYANDERPNPGVAKPRVANDALQDEKLQEFLETVFRMATAGALLANAAWYLWHAHLTQGYFAAAAAAAANVVLHRQIIWVKPVLLLGRGQYHWKHEPCFMGWVDGHQPPDYGEGHGERTQTTVWEVDSVTRSERKEFNHSTPKPIGLFSVPIIKHLKPGEICYEPFAGSAPQLIAAEQHGRRCLAIELEPGFVQVAIDRWEAFTGKKAVKVA